jgi:uncharacterized protein (DUF2236 family)
MIVTARDLEESLARMRAQVEDPRAGIYGPRSMSWAVSRESVLFLGGGRAMLMQLAHPFIAHAIEQRSYAREDPLRRLRRTSATLSAMAFGDLDHVLAAARRLHAVHARVRGTIAEDAGRFARGASYDANHEDALLWVYASLIETVIKVHDLVVRPLSADEKARFYDEKRRFALLFGIRSETMPPDWPALEAYVARMLASDTLAVGKAARAVAGSLLAAPLTPYGSIMRWYRAMTAGLLPPPLRAAFDLPFGAADRVVFATSLAAVRRGRFLLPRDLRFHPAYLAAKRRLAGERDHESALGTYACAFQSYSK